MTFLFDVGFSGMRNTTHMNTQIKKVKRKKRRGKNKKNIGGFDIAVYPNFMFVFRLIFREKDARLRDVIKTYHEGGITRDTICLSESIKQKIVDVFNGESISANTRERMSSPNAFPTDNIGRLKLKSCIFREVDIYPNGDLANLTRRLFAVVILPIMLINRKWEVEDTNSDWLRNLR